MPSVKVGVQKIRPLRIPSRRNGGDDSVRNKNERMFDKIALNSKHTSFKIDFIFKMDLLKVMGVRP